MKLYAVTLGGSRGRSAGSILNASNVGFSHCLITFAGTGPDSLVHAARLFDGVLLDSGAFSVMSRGAKIDLGQYIEFCRWASPMVDFYAGLDVIGDHVGTRKNLDAMMAAGLSPMPTFHIGSPLSELDRLMAEHDRIGLGGIARLRGNKKTEWLDATWRHIRLSEHWPVKIHGWGITQPSLLERYPWCTVDSSSWSLRAAYGMVLTNGDGRMSPKSNSPGSKGVPSLLTEHTVCGKNMRVRRSARVIMKHVSDVTRLWKLRGIEWKDD